MPLTKSYSASFVDAQRELYRHGLLCVPRTCELVPYERWKKLWDEDSCAFLLAPVNGGDRGLGDSLPLTSSVTIRHALRLVREMPSEDVFDEQAFRQALEKAYPGEDFVSAKACADLREIPHFTNFATAVSY